mgnify:CR=1 FL=1
MEFEVRDKEKRVYIWLTHAESQDAALKESLKPIYQKYKAKKYLVAVFESGTRNLQTTLRELLLYNEFRLREIEKEKGRAASGIQADRPFSLKS